MRPACRRYGDGRGDNQSTGTFNVLDIQYGSGSTITSFAADFVQFDELSTSAWNIGSIRYNSTVPIAYPAPPVILSSTATVASSTSEALSGVVNPGGPPTTVYFLHFTAPRQTRMAAPRRRKACSRALMVCRSMRRLRGCRLPPSIITRW